MSPGGWAPSYAICTIGPACTRRLSTTTLPSCSRPRRTRDCSRPRFSSSRSILVDPVARRKVVERIARLEAQTVAQFGFLRLRRRRTRDCTFTPRLGPLTHLAAGRGPAAEADVVAEVEPEAAVACRTALV